MRELDTELNSRQFYDKTELSLMSLSLVPTFLATNSTEYYYFLLKYKLKPLFSKMLTNILKTGFISKCF